MAGIFSLEIMPLTKETAFRVAYFIYYRHFLAGV